MRKVSICDKNSRQKIIRKAMCKEQCADKKDLNCAVSNASNVDNVKCLVIHSAVTDVQGLDPILVHTIL